MVEVFALWKVILFVLSVKSGTTSNFPRIFMDVRVPCDNRHVAVLVLQMERVPFAVSQQVSVGLQSDNEGFLSVQLLQ